MDGNLKSKFVTKEQAEEERKLRQQHWERIRKPDDPIEPPEEVFDPRSLYERLQEQKQKKQDELDERHRLSNQVKGLEDDEVKFLDFVSQRREELENARHLEDRAVLSQFHEVVNSRALDDQSNGLQNTSKRARNSQSTSNSVMYKVKTQQALLAGALKRKSSTSSAQEPYKKQLRRDEPGNDIDKHLDTTNNAKNEAQPETVLVQTVCRRPTAVRVVGVLPGVGIYGDTSDSSNSSSDSDEIDTNFTRKSQTQYVSASTLQQYIDECGE